MKYDAKKVDKLLNDLEECVARVTELREALERSLNEKERQHAA